MKMYFFYSAVLILAVVPVLFVWNEVYKDGVIGRIGLLGISFFSDLILLDSITTTDKYDPYGLTVGIIVCFAVFLVWHLVRFHTRVYSKKTTTADRRRKTDRVVVGGVTE